MAKSNYLSSFLCILVSLPFVYGFANERWTSMIDCMLEKKPGVHKIHTMRIIGLVCPEFNTCLKYFIGHNMQYNYENSSPSSEQHAYRANRQSVEGAMRKLLSMEGARHGRITMAAQLHDSKACFDRLLREESNIYARKINVDKNLLIA